MAFCSKCGTQLSEGVKFCPKCGEAVGEVDNVTVSKTKARKPKTKNQVNGRAKKITSTNIQTQENNNSSEEEGSWADAVVVILGIGLLFMLFWSILEGSWLAILISICGIVALLAIIGSVSNDIIKAISSVVISLAALYGSFIMIDNKTNKEIEEIVQEAAVNEKDDGKESNQVEKKKESPKVFFENGYKYSTSYRVRRNEGYGISCNYKYIIKIFNDGTKEISASNQTDDGSPATYGTHSCEIEKQGGSYRDVQAEWYEIKYKSGTSWGGKYHYGETTIYVDLDGNVIMLGENGNNKNIYEAVATKDCIYGKFQKEKLGKEVYRCKKCGKEYDPGKEALYSEEYCYNDYPQTCKTCGKTYTINTDGNYACLGTCSRCNEKHRNAKIYRDVTGRDY